MRGSRHARRSAILSSQHLFDAFRLELSLSNLHQCSNDVTAHLVQEAIALDDKCHQRTPPANIAAGQGPNRALDFITSIRGEGFEVVLSEEKPRGSLHRGT